MRKEVQDILVDLVLEDVMTGGLLFESNPYHNAEGKFTSKDAAAAYSGGLMAYGRERGIRAKAEGKTREEIRAAIKSGMEYAKRLADEGNKDVRGGAADALYTARRWAARKKAGTLPKEKTTAEIMNSTSAKFASAEAARWMKQEKAARRKW